MKKLVSILCIVAAFVFASKAMADDGGYGMATLWSERNTASWWLPGSDMAYAALKDSSLSLGIERNDTTSGFSYGTFQYDKGSGQIVANSEKLIGSVGAGELGSGVSVAYSAGDLAGVWVKIDGVTYYSQESLNVNRNNTETFRDKAPKGSAYVWFDNAAAWPGQNKADIMILVSGVAPASPAQSGQPLPGVLATVALCSAVGGYLRRKKSAARIDQE